MNLLIHLSHILLETQKRVEAGQLLQKAGYSRSRISVIPQYGVNPKLFRKMNVSKLKKELKLGSFTVGYVGRLVPEKGVQDLLEAFALLKDKKSNLLIVGNDPLRESFEEQGLRLGIADRVRWVPAMDQPRIPQYLNCMDALVLPSRTTPTWKEQFGRVLIEAQACGIPVIGSDSGAIPEVTGKAGIIFPEGNIERLKEALEKLATSLALREELGPKGRRRVLDLYTNQKIADQIHKIHRQALLKRNPENPSV